MLEVLQHRGILRVTDVEVCDKFIKLQHFVLNVFLNITKQ